MILLSIRYAFSIYLYVRLVVRPRPTWLDSSYVELDRQMGGQTPFLPSSFDRRQVALVVIARGCQVVLDVLFQYEWGRTCCPSRRVDVFRHHTDFSYHSRILLLMKLEKWISGRTRFVYVLVSIVSKLVSEGIQCRCWSTRWSPIRPQHTSSKRPLRHITIDIDRHPTNQESYHSQ